MDQDIEEHLKEADRLRTSAVPTRLQAKLKAKGLI